MATKFGWRVDAPTFGHWGRIALIGAKVEWMREGWGAHAGGWVSVQFALLGFSASLTWWRA